MRLVVSCADRPGIVAAISGFLFGRNANIVRSDQDTTDPEGGVFHLRMVFSIGDEALGDFREAFQREVADAFGMRWWLWDERQPRRIAIFVSRYEHCLLDLLWRWRRGELGAEVTLVASNHPELEGEVRQFGVPYHHVPTPRDRKAEAEAELAEIVEGECDLIVLARYMQILSKEFLERVGVPLINIHHSFLPAFPGAKPYEQARERGVKLVGATAHYVTEELDSGPIIEQDVIRVSHRDDAESLERRGADVERSVLSRAVRWHCEDRVLQDGERTVVF